MWLRRAFGSGGTTLSARPAIIGSKPRDQGASFGLSVDGRVAESRILLAFQQDA